MREAPAGATTERWDTGLGRILGAMLALTLCYKLALVVHLDGRVYPDVLRSANFGLGLAEGLVSIRSHVDNSRSFLGPLLGAAVYRVGGVTAIKLLNLLLFAGLFAVAARLGLGRHDRGVVVVALALFAFYAGGHRNVAAGEIEDNLASLVFAIALLVHARRERVIAPALLMGVAFLVKFWIVIFVAGFGLFLLSERRVRDASLLALGAAAPLLAVTALDGGATLGALLMSAERQTGYSSWPTIAFRLLSTGLLPTVALAAWTAWRRPRPRSRLYLMLVASYLAYVLLFRDAHAVTFVMMLCLVPAGFLVAEALVASPLLGGARRAARWRLAVVLAAYAMANGAIAWHNLQRDTRPFDVRPAAGAKPLAGAPARDG